jgi:hypothetical protein
MDHDLFVFSHNKWKELFPGQRMVKPLGAIRSYMGVPGLVKVIFIKILQKMLLPAVHLGRHHAHRDERRLGFFFSI